MRILETDRTYKWGSYFVKIIQFSGCWVTISISLNHNEKPWITQDITIEQFMMSLDMEYEFYKDIAEMV